MGDVTRIPTRPRIVHPHSVLSDPSHRNHGAAARVVESHRIVEAAARDLHTGDPGSGVKALAFACANHLALTIGPDAAGNFLDAVARGARNHRRGESPPA